MILTVLGTVLLVAATVALGLYLDRKLALLPRGEKLAERAQLPPDVAGEAPATAIRARPAQIDRLRTQRCRSCQAPLAPQADDHVRYDGKRLLVLRFTCSACGAKRSIYIHPT